MSGGDCLSTPYNNCIIQYRHCVKQEVSLDKASILVRDLFCDVRYTTFGGNLTAILTHDRFFDARKIRYAW